MSKSDPGLQSATDRRAAEAELGTLVVKFAEGHASLFAAARKGLRKWVPAAHEVVYEYRDCVVVSFSPTEQGYEGALALRADAEGVKLYFQMGKQLSDPEKLLRGSANARWVDLEEPATLKRPAVEDLIREAIARNRVAFAESGGGSVVVRATTAKKAAGKSAKKKAVKKAASKTNRTESKKAVKKMSKRGR